MSLIRNPATLHLRWIRQAIQEREFSRSGLRFLSCRWVTGLSDRAYQLWFSMVPGWDSTKPDGPRIDAEGVGLWSHFDIYKDMLWWRKHWISQQGYQPSSQIPTPEPGLYIAEYLDSAMIRQGVNYLEDQTRDILIKADTSNVIEPLPGYTPIITSISTNREGIQAVLPLTSAGMAWS